MSVVSEEKQRSEPGERFHFNGSKSKNTVVTVVRYHFSSSEVKQRSD